MAGVKTFAIFIVCETIPSRVYNIHNQKKQTLSNLLIIRGFKVI